MFLTQATSMQTSLSPVRPLKIGGLIHLCNFLSLSQGPEPHPLPPFLKLLVMVESDLTPESESDGSSPSSPAPADKDFMLST